jgi:plastocyanin
MYVETLCRFPLLLAVLLGVYTSSADAVPTDVLSGRVELGVPSSVPTLQRYRYQRGRDPEDPDPPRAVVYLNYKSEQSSHAEAKTVDIAQRGLQFRPQVLAIRVGTKIRFPNEDTEYHNVFSYSRNARFDLGRYKSGEKPPEQVFDTTGLVKLYCEIHEHMRGAILVLDTDYFVMTDENGRYALELAQLPAGSYTVIAWLGEDKQYQREYTHVPGKGAELNFP